MSNAALAKTRSRLRAVGPALPVDSVENKFSKFASVSLLETPFETELNGAWTVCVERMQEGCARDAINSACLKAGGILRSRITTHDIVPAATRIVRIVNAELRLVENVEKLGAKLKIAGLCQLETLEECQVKVQTRRVIQEVPAGISKG